MLALTNIGLLHLMNLMTNPALPIPQIKQSLLEAGIVDDNAYCHILSGLGAGFFAVVCGSPVDVVKSRMMGRSQPKELWMGVCSISSHVDPAARQLSALRCLCCWHSLHGHT